MRNGSGPFDWRGPDFLRFYLVLLVSCFAASAWLRWKLRQSAGLPREGVGELGPYEVAFLNDGNVLAVNTAMAALIDQGTLRADPASKAVIVTGELAPDAHPLENAVYVAAAQPGGQKLR